MIKGGKCVHAIKVICITTGKEFDCAKDGSDFYKCDNSRIGKCCKGKGKSCGKLEDGTPLQWMYYDDYIKQNNLQKRGD